MVLVGVVLAGDEDLGRTPRGHDLGDGGDERLFVPAELGVDEGEAGHVVLGQAEHAARGP